MYLSLSADDLKIKYFQEVQRCKKSQEEIEEQHYSSLDSSDSHCVNYPWQCTVYHVLNEPSHLSISKK